MYGTAFTLALVDGPLDEEPRFIKVKPKEIVEIGPFKIEFIHVTQSIVSAVALAIVTPLGVIIHTGDFKEPTHPGLTAKLDIQDKEKWLIAVFRVFRMPEVGERPTTRMPPL